VARSDEVLKEACVIGGLQIYSKMGLGRVAITKYIRCIYGSSGRETTKYTVIYGVDIRLWPTLGKHSVQQT